jgi:hypothetical protein
VAGFQLSTEGIERIVRKPESAKFIVVNNPEENDSRRLHHLSPVTQ